MGSSGEDHSRRQVQRRSAALCWASSQRFNSPEWIHSRKNTASHCSNPSSWSGWATHPFNHGLSRTQIPLCQTKCSHLFVLTLHSVRCWFVKKFGLTCVKTALEGRRSLNSTQCFHLFILYWLVSCFAIPLDFSVKSQHRWPSCLNGRRYLPTFYHWVDS